MKMYTMFLNVLWHIDLGIMIPILLSRLITIGIKMQKRCSSCAVIIDENNCVRRDEKKLRNQCKQCIVARNKKHLWDSGLFKFYDCEHCGKPCIRGQKRALCSLKCRLMGNIEKVPCLGLPDKECWQWKGRKTSENYGEMMISKTRWRVHRVAYEVFKGGLSPEKNIVVRHRCDNTLCINPNHLEQGTFIENINDMKQRGRSLKGENNPMNKDFSDHRSRFIKVIAEHKTE